jgi:hypothetical protein
MQYCRDISSYHADFKFLKLALLVASIVFSYIFIYILSAHSTLLYEIFFPPIHVSQLYNLGRFAMNSFRSDIGGGIRSRM